MLKFSGDPEDNKLVIDDNKNKGYFPSQSVDDAFSNNKQELNFDLGVHLDG